MSYLVKYFVVKPYAVAALNELEITDSEKQKLAETITLLYHQALVNSFLEQLDQKDKQTFLELHMKEAHEDSVQFLQERIVNLDSVVEEALKQIEEKILEDVALLKGE